MLIQLASTLVLAAGPTAVSTPLPLVEASGAEIPVQQEKGSEKARPEKKQVQEIDRPARRTRAQDNPSRGKGGGRGAEREGPGQEARTGGDASQGDLRDADRRVPPDAVRDGQQDGAGRGDPRGSDPDVQPDADRGAAGQDARPVEVKRADELPDPRGRASRADRRPTDARDAAGQRPPTGRDPEAMKKKLALEERKHRERLAKIGRLRELALANDQTQRLAALDELERKEAQRYERWLTEGRKELGEKEYGKVKAKLEKGRKRTTGPKGERDRPDQRATTTERRTPKPRAREDR